MLTRISEDNLPAVINKGSVILLILMTGAGFLQSPRFAWSVLAGGILVLLNHCWLRNILARVLAGYAGNAATYTIMRYLLRLTLIAVAIVALFRLNVDLAGLFVGLSTLVITTILVSIYSLVASKGEES